MPDTKRSRVTSEGDFESTVARIKVIQLSLSEKQEEFENMSCAVDGEEAVVKKAIGLSKSGVQLISLLGSCWLRLVAPNSVHPHPIVCGLSGKNHLDKMVTVGTLRKMGIISAVYVGFSRSVLYLKIDDKYALVSLDAGTSVGHVERGRFPEEELKKFDAELTDAFDHVKLGCGPCWRGCGGYYAYRWWCTPWGYMWCWVCVGCCHVK